MIRFVVLGVVWTAGTRQTTAKPGTTSGAKGWAVSLSPRAATTGSPRAWQGKNTLNTLQSMSYYRQGMTLGKVKTNKTVGNA